MTALRLADTRFSEARLLVLRNAEDEAYANMDAWEGVRDNCCIASQEYAFATTQCGIQYARWIDAQRVADAFQKECGL